MRTSNVMRVYFASTYSDFIDEFKEVYDKVFPKLDMLCQSMGYTFGTSIRTNDGSAHT